MSMVRETSGAMARGTVLGFIAGVLPGAGASLGSFIAYSAEKKWKGKRGRFGQGDPSGVAAPEAGNNAAAGGALVPMLALGVPGSGTTAVLLAMLMALDITPGPLLFQKNPDVVWGLIAALFIGNGMLLLMNIPMVGLFARVLRIPSRYLMPGVAMVSFVGIYGISGSTFDLYIMVGFGVMGWLFRKLDIPLVPVVLGIMLGDQMEKNLRRAMTISDGDWGVLVSTPLATGLLIAAAIGFIAPFFLAQWIRIRKP
jgi:putative tricarboxylic transport membrane protein